MQRFVSFTLKQKVLFNLLFVLLMVIGAFTLLRMPVERYPNIQFGNMYINTYLPGASPEDIETLVTKEIEESLEDLEKVEYIRSSSYRERSNIVIKFEDDSDYEKRFDDVRLKVLSVVDDLPELTEPPVFNFLDVNDWFPTISVNVAGEHTNETLTRVAETLKIPLTQLDGVREVKISGDYTREFHIILSAEKLRRVGITFSEVAQTLRSANSSIPAGHAETENGEFVVRVDDAIVVVENIYRHHQMGKSAQDAIITGTSEVFLPVVSATLTTVVAFLPMLIMTGMVGDFFAIIPKTIVFALVASILECRNQG